MGVTPEFWRQKRILVTGHTGFKGSWLSIWLLSLGAEVYGMALPPGTTPNLFEAAGLADKMNHNIADIRDFTAVSETIRQVRPDIIIHMAAVSIVSEAYADPVSTYSTNVMGTVHLLEAARKYNELASSHLIKSVLVVTSDKCYENKETQEGYKEGDAMGGSDPYSSSKGCAELAVSAYQKSYFSENNSTLAVASARAGNVIGGGDWAKDRLLPDGVRAFFSNRPLVIRNPDAVRPWQYVLEPLSGYLMVAQRLYEYGQEYSGGWNFGPARESARSVEYVVDRLVELWGKGATWQLDDSDHPHEARLLFLDSAKSQSQLGWKCHMVLTSSLEVTLEGYKEFASAPSNTVYKLATEEITVYSRLSARMIESTHA